MKQPLPTTAARFIAVSQLWFYRCFIAVSKVGQMPGRCAAKPNQAKIATKLQTAAERSAAVWSLVAIFAWFGFAAHLPGIWPTFETAMKQR